MPKLIGIDYGTKRVGVAVSDESGSIAFPKATFPNDRALIPTIVALIRKENAGAVVVGESKNQNGNDNPIMKNVRTFVAELERAIAIVIHFEPEFYTSVEARRKAGEAGGVHTHVDAEAAAVILNSFIERSKK